MGLNKFFIFPFLIFCNMSISRKSGGNPKSGARPRSYDGKAWIYRLDENERQQKMSLHAFALSHMRKG